MYIYIYIYIYMYIYIYSIDCFEVHSTFTPARHDEYTYNRCSSIDVIVLL